MFGGPAGCIFEDVMPSKFDEYLIAADQHQWDMYGVDVVYTPKGGDDIQTKGILGPVETEMGNDENGETLLKFRQICVSIADVSSPEIGDIITAEGQKWIVTSEPAVDVSMATLQTRLSKTISRYHETHKQKLPTR
jgi:hypothetical protein